MLRGLKAPSNDRGDAATVAGRMAARKALTALLVQTRPENRASLLEYVEERAASLRLHARREGAVASFAPVAAGRGNASGRGNPSVRPATSAVRREEFACRYPGQLFGIVGHSDVLDGGTGTAPARSVSKVEELGIAAIGACGVGSYVPTCNPEFFTTTSSSPSSATIMGVSATYLAGLGCAISGSQTATLVNGGRVREQFIPVNPCPPLPPLPPGPPPPPVTVRIHVQQGFVSMAGNGLVVLGGPGGLTTTSITAQGSPAGGSVTWTAGPKLEINGINSANASVTGTAPSTQGGDTYVSVRYVVGSQSAESSVRFTVLDPRTFVAVNYPGGAESTVPYSYGNYSGYITTMSYYVDDQLAPPNHIVLPGMTNLETLTTLSNPFGASFDPPDNQPKAGSSDLNGQMTDLLSAYGPGGLPQGFTASRLQSWTVNGFNFGPAQRQNFTSTFATVTRRTLSRQ